ERDDPGAFAGGGRSDRLRDRRLPATGFPRARHAGAECHHRELERRRHRAFGPGLGARRRRRRRSRSAHAPTADAAAKAGRTDADPLTIAGGFAALVGIWFGLSGAHGIDPSHPAARVSASTRSTIAGASPT